MDTYKTDPTELFKKMTRLMLLTQRAMNISQRVQIMSLAKATGSEFSLMDGQTLATAYAKTWFDLMSRPAELFQAQLDAGTAATNLWNAISETKGNTRESDRRFKDKSWSEDTTARMYREVYRVFENTMGELLDRLDDQSRDQLRVKFYTRQMLSVLSPSNYFVTNAAAKRKFLESGGDSLLDGLDNLLDDLERGDGRLDLSTNDPKAFKVGTDLGTTEGEVVFENELMQLIQYHPRTEEQREVPILFVPAWINKFYILDMQPKNSLVRYMLDRGHSVFVISWVNPTKEHAEKDFADYMTLGPLAALEAIRNITKQNKANILGFCIGGILVTATLAYLAAIRDNQINSATTLATMVDFENVGEIGVFIDDNRLEILRSHMADKGYLDAHHLQDMFSMLRENDLIWSFYEANYLRGSKPRAFDLLFWNSDSTRLPSAMLLWYLERIYLQNLLRQPGGLEMNGVKIDVAKITTPCFILATVDDHIAPWTSVYPSTGLFGGEIEFVLGGSGHIAGVINPPSESRQKYGYLTSNNYPANPDEFLKISEKHEGSWWPHWADWIERQSGKMVPARTVAKRGEYKSVEPAPGRYVFAQ